MENDLIVLGQDDAAARGGGGVCGTRPIHLAAIRRKALRDPAVCAGSQLSGITYLKGKGRHQSRLPQLHQQCHAERPRRRPENAALASVHELVATAGGATTSATSSKDLPAIPPPPARRGRRRSAATDAAAAGGDAEAAGPARLDLATLYTSRGLFRGTARMPIPSNLDGQLYVPAGAAGIAMANLAARMGVETTGITLPLATPAPAAAVRDVRTKSVVAASSLSARRPNASSARKTPRAGTNPLSRRRRRTARRRQSFGRRRGAGARRRCRRRSRARSARRPFPESLGRGKQYLSLEEIRYDLHRFFSLRSGRTGRRRALSPRSLDEEERRTAARRRSRALRRRRRSRSHRFRAQPGSGHSARRREGGCPQPPRRHAVLHDLAGAALSGAGLSIPPGHAHVPGRSRDSLGRHAPARGRQGRAAEIQPGGT